MIVRNEATRLPRCLSSIREHVDAIYVTDTGSKDETVQIARQYGAEIRHFIWCDDFAAARNQSIAGVKEDWLLIMDADDSFPEGEAQRIKPWLQDCRALSLTVRYRTTYGHTPAATRRLLRNRAGLKFNGRIHESIRASFPPGIGNHTSHSDLCLSHHGFDGPDQSAKEQRYLPLLRDAWETAAAGYDSCQRITIGAHLGQILLNLGQTEAGEAILQTTLGRTAFDHEEANCALTSLSTLVWWLQQADRHDEAIKLCDGLNPHFPVSGAFHLYQGLAYFGGKEFTKALQTLNLFEQAWNSGVVDVSVPEPYTNLALWDLQGQCNLKVGNYAEAARLFRQCQTHGGNTIEFQTKLHLAQRLAET